MKIVHLCLAGPVTDGWTYQENLLSKYHRKMGHEVAIIASRWVYGTGNQLYKFPENDYFLQDGRHMIRLEIKGDVSVDRRCKRYCRLYEAIEEEAPNILFIHGCQFLDIYTVVRYIKKHSEVTTYLDNHADFSNSASNIISRSILHGLIWKSCAKAIEPYVQRFYGVLPARAEFLKEIYKIPENKIELLLMGADDEEVKKAENEEQRRRVRSKYQVSDNDFLIVTGGKIDLAKTQTLLLMEAVKNTRNSRIKLIVFGSVVPELLEKVVNLSDGEKLQYIGWINGNESYSVFAAADLVVFPGRHSVFWEQAAGQGIPMLVKYWEGTTHIDFGGNVEFLYRDSAEEIREKLEQIMDPEHYSVMKEIAEKNRSNFMYSTIAKKSIEEV